VSNVKEATIAKGFTWRLKENSYYIKNQLSLNWGKDVIFTLCIGIPFCRLNQIKYKEQNR